MAFILMKNQSRRKISVTSAWTFQSLTSIKTYEVQGDYLISSCISFRNTYLTINFPHTPRQLISPTHPVRDQNKIRTKMKIQKWQRRMKEITVSPMTSRMYMYRTLRQLLVFSYFESTLSQTFHTKGRKRNKYR